MNREQPFNTGAVIRLGSLQHPPGAFGCIVARPPVESSLDAVARPGEIAAIINHDPGCTWPDRASQDLGRAVLEQGGVAVLAFSSLGDTLQCRARIQREAAR